MTQVKIQRRSLRNVVLTQRHHLPLMGLSMAISLSLLLVLYALFLYEIYELGRGGADVPVIELLIFCTAMVCLLGLGVVGAGMLAAHRVAGVYIKLKSVFEQVGQGDLDAQLRFRVEDRLGSVEESFQKMMKVVRQNIPDQTTSS